jgi:hypothetical protein
MDDERMARARAPQNAGRENQRKQG